MRPSVVVPLLVQLYFTMFFMIVSGGSSTKSERSRMPARYPMTRHDKILMTPGACTLSAVVSSVLHTSERMMPTNSGDAPQSSPMSAFFRHTSTWLLWTMYGNAA